MDTVPPSPPETLEPDLDAPMPRRRPSPLVAGFVALAVAATGVLGASAVLRDERPRVGNSSEYRFLATHVDGRPVRWNPCEPIHYVVNLNGAPDGSLADVQEAFRRISAATGITFVDDGMTDELPTRGRAPSDIARYHAVWSPILVAWVAPDQTDIPFDHEGNDAAAVARPLFPQSGKEIYVSGWVAVNLDDPNPPGWASPGAQGPTILHELGHVMGLDHVKFQGELMEPAGGGMADLGPGDRQGLRLLGRDAGCLMTPGVPISHPLP